MMNWSDDMSGMNGWGVAFMLTLWVAVVAIAVLLVLRSTRGDQDARTLESPRQILARRFAAGELTSTEYATACRLLEERTPESAPPR